MPNAADELKRIKIVQIRGAESRWRCRKMQSSHLPTTRAPASAGGGPRHPRRQEEPASELVGHEGTERGGEVEAGQDRCPEGWLRGGRGSHAWKDPRGLGSGECAQRFPCPISQGSLPGSRVRSYALRGPLWATLVLGE